MIADKKTDAKDDQDAFLRSRAGWRAAARPTSPEAYDYRHRKKYGNKMLRALRSLRGVGSVRRIRS